VDFQNHTIGHPYHRHFQLFAGGGILLSSHCAVHTAVSLETLLPRVAPPRRVGRVKKLASYSPYIWRPVVCLAAPVDLRLMIR
jgi:hypothetical protein